MVRLDRLKAMLLIGLIALPVAATAAAGKHFEKKFTVAPGGVLVIRTEIGEISVAGTSANEVSIRADIIGDEGVVGNFLIKANQTDTGVEVAGRKRDCPWWTWWRSCTHPDVMYTLAVPRNYSLDVYTSDGDVFINNVKGTIKTGTKVGYLRILNVEGSVTVGPLVPSLSRRRLVI